MPWVPDHGRPGSRRLHTAGHRLLASATISMARRWHCLRDFSCASMFRDARWISILIREQPIGESTHIHPFVPTITCCFSNRSLNQVMAEPNAAGCSPRYGAIYSGVSEDAARGWSNYCLLAEHCTARVGGKTNGYLLPPGVHFHFGSHIVDAGQSVVVDLSALKRHHGFTIAGVLLSRPALLGADGRLSRFSRAYRRSVTRLRSPLSAAAENILVCFFK